MCNILTFKGQYEYNIAIGYYKCIQTEVKQNFVEFKRIKKNCFKEIGKMTLGLSYFILPFKKLNFKFHLT